MKADNMAASVFLRFQTDKYTGPGCVIDDRVYPVSGDIFGDFQTESISCSLDEIRFLPPCAPQKIICVGLNYTEHAAESTLTEIPAEPVLFFKPTSSLIGHLDKIVLPAWVDRVDYEGELAVVIGKKLKDASADQALNGIFGYTCLNDVTARNIQKTDKQWTRAKGFDTFCPIGPFIVRHVDSSALNLETRLNGKTVQKSNTKKMIKSPAEIISFVSKVMTLYPGDVISTGTPAGIGPLKSGDIIEVEIENIGRLRNFAIDDSA
jgi:2-keto-4-pentenoate hydratase/2-oxohepta-3-ene-1,7-dioic acid hydratase in catechol pathway